MHSIRTKVTTITILAVLISTLLIGVVSIFTVRNEAEHRSEQLMALICEAQCDEISNYLGNIEASVGTVSRYAYESLDVVALAKGDVVGATGSGDSLDKRVRTAQQQQDLDAYLQGHLAEVESVFETVGENNASVIDYYYRINPEISSKAQGFWYSRLDTPSFEQRPLTAIEDFKAEDFEHVGWYYLPLERGRPSWVDPYENANLGTWVVSYITPIYKYGTFIGVIGIDVSYDNLVDRLKDLEVLDSGYAFLTDEKGMIIYHPELPYGTLLSDISPDLAAAKHSTESDQLLSYTYNGVSKEAAWDTLADGLRLVVCAPDSEINAGWHNLSLFIMVAALVIVIAFVFITMQLMKRITNPLERLVIASKQLSAGNYNVELTYEGDDEVGLLTKSFNQMTKDLKVFIDDLNSKAYRDVLTGLRNKGAFELFTYKLDGTIKNAVPDAKPKFAVAMFDCNELKVINDTYGHDKGDIYLQRACHLICKVFAHSPVFRIGGDEFAAILQEGDLKNMAELEQRFEEEAVRINDEATDPWRTVNIARGIAIYDPERDPDMESVLRRADETMYANKRAYKDSRNSQVR